MELKPLDSMTVAEMREEYARMMRVYPEGTRALNVAVRLALALAAIQNPTPADYVRTARAQLVSCPRCAGTGQFVTGMVNGKPTGPGGPCYRCHGGGRQDVHDWFRNNYYDCHCIRPF